MENYENEPPERTYQNSLVKLFSDKETPGYMGYDYIGNLQYPRGKTVNKYGYENTPIIESRLKEYLKSTKKYTDFQINEAVRVLKEKSRLSDYNPSTLPATNNEVYKYLVSGVSAKPSPEKNEEEVELFDFDDVEKNHFAIAEEVSFIDPVTGKDSDLNAARPDIVIYVNGIALCVLELKKSSISLSEGIRQHLSNECTIIPSFFTTTQFTVVARPSDPRTLGAGEEIEEWMYGFKYATIHSAARYWCPWKKNTNKTGIVLSDTECFKDFFCHEQFMFLFRYGVLSDGGFKKVMRPHQYYALQAAAPRLRNKKARGGVIWHSQGSGKSLTMVWLASYIKDNFEDPRVLVITDRTELDAQLSRDFAQTGKTLHRATSQDDLLKTLNRGEEWLICTLIHKFGLAEHEGNGEGRKTKNKRKKDRRAVVIPLDKILEKLKAEIKRKYGDDFTVKGKNIFVFIDECHRTQGGTLHESMKEIMGKDVKLIGFTGTPLLKDEKKTGYRAFRNMTERKFGEFIHKYLHKQAVEDKVILDLQYEARDVEQVLSSKEELDKKLQDITRGLPQKRKEQIEARWATLERVYSSKERIERVGFSILKDMKYHTILRENWANAMLVAEDIYSAFRYYEFFQNPSSFIHDRVAVVTSYNPSDNTQRKAIDDPYQEETEEKYKYRMAHQAFKDAGADIKNTDDYEKWARNAFVHDPGHMKLVIVVDKLLTGFDAPCATVLYIDKDMRDHALFQAICRVNRLGADVKDSADKVIEQTGKEFGIIVDFKHLFGEIKGAVTRFNDENGGFGGFDNVDMEGLLEDSIVKNKKRLTKALKSFEQLKALWESKGINSDDSLFNFYETDAEGDPADERRKSLYRITGALVSAYNNIADDMSRAGFSTEEAEEIDRLAHEASRRNRYIKRRSGDEFDPHEQDPSMRALLDEHIRANSASLIVPATEEFSFLDLITDDTDIDELIEKIKEKEKGDSKATAERIEGKARSVINNSKDRDRALYETFSARLQWLLDQLHASKASLEEWMKQLIQLIKDVKNGGRDFPKEVNTPLKKALWNNREKCGLSDDDAVALEQVTKIQNLVDNYASPGYRNPANKHGFYFYNKILKKNFPDLSEDQLQEIYTIIRRN